MKRIRAVFLAVGLVSCQPQSTTATHLPPEGELLEFAEANCFFWYFKKKGYDTSDIQGVTGGIVEMGSYAPEAYEKIAELVRNYLPPIASKATIDIDLHRCFYMDKDPNFLASIRQIFERQS